MNYRTFEDLGRIIHKNISIIAEQEFDLIVGIPRSGMIPAYMIALDLNIPICSYFDFIENKEIKRNAGRDIKKNIKYPQEAKKILIVEDSYNTGEKLAKLLNDIPKIERKKCQTMAVYSAIKDPMIDYFFELVPQPRMFEWNIMHHPDIKNSCFDMDGVLCEDPTGEQNDDGKKYLEFIKKTKPKYIPTYTIDTIITSRLEKYRKPTEEWLKKHNVKYNNLIMLNGVTAEERRKLGLHGKFKANEYKNSKYTLFYESNYDQAVEINMITKKPVYCVDENKMIYDNVIKDNNQSKLLNIFYKIKYKTHIRTRIKSFIKKIS